MARAIPGPPIHGVRPHLFGTSDLADPFCRAVRITCNGTTNCEGSQPKKISVRERPSLFSYSEKHNIQLFIKGQSLIASTKGLN